MELMRMEVLVLTDTRTGSTARILPELGFNCFEFRTQVAGQSVDVIDASPQFASGHEKPSGHGIPLLFPVSEPDSGTVATHGTAAITKSRRRMRLTMRRAMPFTVFVWTAPGA